MSIRQKCKNLIPFLVLFALLSLLCRELYSASSNEMPSALLGDPIPAFSLPYLNGSGTFTQHTIPKGRVSLINIWASWCAACQQEHSMMMKIKNTYHIPVYGILYKDNARDANYLLNNEGNPYVLIGNDYSGEVAIDFGVYGTPETYVISPSGRIVYKHVGVISQQTWDRVIYPLIKKYNKHRE